MDTAFLIKAFGAVFAIMNPFLALPVFLSLTDGYEPARQRRTAIRMVMYCAVLCAVVMVAGSAVLGVFGIKVDDFRLAGGIVLFTIALGMLNGHTRVHEGSRAEQRQHLEASQAGADVSFYPLAFPMTVGPGTIATIVLLSGTEGTGGRLELAVVLAVILALLLLVLINAAAIGRHMSQTMRTIVTRLMGMILASIAVQMVVAALQHLLPGLTR